MGTAGRQQGLVTLLMLMSESMSAKRQTQLLGIGMNAARVVSSGHSKHYEGQAFLAVWHTTFTAGAGAETH